MDKTPTQVRTAQFAPSDSADGRIPVVISSDAVVEMPYGKEILLHTREAVDLTRAPLPIIVTHRSGQINVGLVEDISIANGVMRGMAVFGQRDEAQQYAHDVVGGTIRSVSVGYQRAKGYMRADGVTVVTRWVPTHTALVAEPADVNAGFYREADRESAAPPFDLEELPSPVARASAPPEIQPSLPGSGTTPGDRSMTTETPAPVAAPAAPAAPQNAARAADIQLGADPLAAERERAREIRAMGRQFNMTEQADQAIDSGASIDAFRTLVISSLKDKGALRVAESPEIGLSEREAQQFSFCRALLAAADPLNAAKLAPFEMECSRAAQDKRGDSRDKIREAAVTIPVDVLCRGMQLTDGMAAAAARLMIRNAQRSSRAEMNLYRDLTVGAPTAGGNLVATELLGSSFIDLLRHAMVLDRLGITWLRDLNGNIAIPSQTGAATAYWVAESGAPTESAQTVGQVTLSPKTVGAFTDYSRRLLLQSSIDVEAFVRADLAAIIGLAIQAAAINGAGASNEPTGILNTSGIGSVAGGTNGLAPTYAHMVALETALGNANADFGSLAYLTNSKVRGKLRTTEEFATTNGKPVWTSMPGQRGVGEVLGYEALVTNSVPSTLTKGTSSGVCSAILFGNWADLLLGMWGGLDVMLDPYTGATSGTKRVIALQDLDVAVRHVESFAAMKDALTT